MDKPCPYRRSASGPCFRPTNLAPARIRTDDSMAEMFSNRVLMNCDPAGTPKDWQGQASCLKSLSWSFQTVRNLRNFV